MFKYLILPFLLTCSHFTPQSEIFSFRDEYFSKTNQPLIEIHFRFSYYVELSNGQQVVGLCTINTRKNRRTIDIDIGYYSKLTKQQKRILIFHELEHCARNKSHDFSTLTDGCPGTLMFPSLPSPRCAYKHYTRYIDGLTK